VGRARLEELIGKIEERHSTLKDLREIPLLLVNAIRGVVPVAMLNGAAVPQSSLTDELAKRFWP
jgi:branched-subunit amino acid aminotransferase/4-amino-4-deoxychorismate lyase